MKAKDQRLAVWAVVWVVCIVLLPLHRCQWLASNENVSVSTAKCNRYLKGLRKHFISNAYAGINSLLCFYKYITVYFYAVSMFLLFLMTANSGLGCTVLCIQYLTQS